MNNRNARMNPNPLPVPNPEDIDKDIRKVKEWMDELNGYRDILVKHNIEPNPEALDVYLNSK